MKLAIICAMDEELAAIWATIPMKRTNELEKAGNMYWQYSLGLHELITVVSGIGKVNAAVTTQILLDNFVVDGVINVGVAGSISPDLTFGDVVVASDLVEHDFDVTAFGDKLGQIPRMDTFSFATDENLNQLLTKNLQLPAGKLVTGRIVSGDQFIDDATKAAFLAQEFAAVACEMEGAAIAHTCYLNKVPVAVIRSLSDMAGQQGSSGAHSFNDLKFMAAARAAKVVVNLLEHI